jgi:SAM-dependent methyltransferase
MSREAPRRGGAIPMPACRTYIDGSYDTKTGGTWHLEDSAFKARQVLRMLDRHRDVRPRSVCDIGCGAGGILAVLDRKLEPSARLVGYDVSPQALSLCRQFETGRCRFVLGDAFADASYFDLALTLDVIEHVEDCFSFLRQCAAKAAWKMYHIPLDASASTILRGSHCWDSVGHLHLFTMETALKSVEYSGQRVIDWFLTPASLERPHSAATRLTNLPRRILPESLAARLFGGYSVMILAQ